MKKELKTLLLDYKLNPDDSDLQQTVLFESETILIAIIKHFKKFYSFLEFDEISDLVR